GLTAAGARLSPWCRQQRLQVAPGADFRLHGPFLLALDNGPLASPWLSAGAYRVKEAECADEVAADCCRRDGFDLRQPDACRCLPDGVLADRERERHRVCVEPQSGNVHLGFVLIQPVRSDQRDIDFSAPSVGLEYRGHYHRAVT